MHEARQASAIDPISFLVSKADRPDHPRSAERFNEEQATYAVRGDGQPDLEAGVAAIREVWRTLPRRPGV